MIKSSIEREKVIIDAKEVSRLLQIYDNTGKIIKFSYNGKNQLTSLVNGVGRKTTYLYDDEGFLKEVCFDNKKHLMFEYNEHGEIISVQDN